MVLGKGCVLLCLLCSFALNAAELKVAVAANFKPLLQKLTVNFEQSHEVKVRLSSASTGVLYAQILHGAPFDVFLAADSKRPLLLEQQQLSVAGSRQTYAKGLLVLWHRGAADKPSLSLLQNWQARIALANVKTAPYGSAAKAVLQHRQLWQPLFKRLVYGNNIAQTYQMVDSGNVELGFVALSQVLGHQAGDYWVLPASWYPPIEQQLVVLKRSESVALAQQFADWLMSKLQQQSIAQSGYAIDAQ